MEADLSPLFALASERGTQWACPRAQAGVSGSLPSPIFGTKRGGPRVTIKYKFNNCFLLLNFKIMLNLIGKQSSRFLKPQKDKQEKIATKIHASENKIIYEEIILVKYKFVKQALMSDLLTGRVRVKYEEDKTEAV